MKIIGLTGGIGSGKSAVSNFLAAVGVPIYDSDSRAKKLMLTPLVRTKVIAAFGEESYEDKRLNNHFIAAHVFNDEQKLDTLNQIVHPAVFQDFKDWVKKQTGLYVVKESAILLESGSYKDCDLVVSIIADEELRIHRVKERSGLTEQQIRNRIKNQCTDSERKEFSDYLIENNSTLEDLKKKTLELHNILRKKYE